MTATHGLIPLQKIHAHPNNPRHEAVADDDMVASVKTQGLIQDLVVAPRDGEYVLIAGHRRLDACTKAGMQSAPCKIRDDLVTDAQMVEAMIIENGHRKDLTAVEEAEGYAQLELFGYKAKDIAQAVGRSAATVKSRLKLTHLPQGSLEKLHQGQMTIADAEALLEFEDDPEQLAELEEFAGTSNFRYRVERARDDQQRRARWHKMIADFETAGAVAVPWPGQYNRTEGPCPLDWTSIKDPDGHAKCLGWTHSGHSYTDPLLVCTDPAAHPQAEQDTTGDDDRAQREAEFEAQRAAREQAAAEQKAAARVRIGHLATHFVRLVTARNLPKPFVESLRVTLPAALCSSDGFDADAFLIAAGLDTEGVRWWTFGDDHIATVRGMTPAGLLKTLAALMAAQAEQTLASAEDPAAWDWLKSTGYAFSDVDTQLHADAVTAAAEEGAA